ncbi:MAG: hypothetical protein C4294_18655 [Nitrospiraceae bacterium]
MNTTHNMNTKEIYKNASSFKRMLKNEGFTAKEIKELVGDDVITPDELSFYQNFKTTTRTVSYSTVCSSGGRRYT